VTDVETYPWKYLTDVVVRGHVYPQTKSHAQAEVQVPPFAKVLSVSGDRRCVRGPDGRVRFSSPEPFEKIPLEYDRAYGGIDKRSEIKHRVLWKALEPYMDKPVDLAAYSLYAYPRNRHGRGYLVEATEEAVEELLLPNIEDPQDLLAPDRLAAGDPYAWHTMPLPAGTTWVPPAYFGRGVFAGMFPYWKHLPDELTEFARFFLPREVKGVSIFGENPLVLRFTNGASLGLQLPYLKPRTRITLLQMHATAPRLEIELPDDAPRISTGALQGGPVETEPVLHTVEIEPDQGRLSLVWRGATPVKRPYMEEELAKMPFRVEWRMS
jgi:hypothetical protein